MIRLPLAFGLIGLLTACNPAKVGLGDISDTDSGNTDTIDSGDTDTDGPGNDPSIDDDGDGYSEDEGDCNDTDEDINPGEDEVDGDGVDNDCDGYTDEIEVCDGVSGDIQDAFDDAEDGGTILICAGTYEETLSVSGKDLLVIGIDGADQTTIIAATINAPVLSISQNADVVIQGLTLTGGTVTDSGGGIQCDGADLGLIEAAVTGNSAVVNGGGISSNNCDIEITGSVIAGNTAEAYGGGIYTNRTDGTITGSTIDSNTGYEGGGLFLSGGDIDLIGNIISTNLATTIDEEGWGPGGGGGGFWINNSSLFEGNTVTGNTSQYHAGGGYFYQGSPDLIDNVVADNISWEDGAGIYLNYPSSPSISGNVFENNESYDDAGGLRIYVGSNADVDNNTFIGNIAADDGGGAKFSHSEHSFTNNYLEGNVAGDAGGGFELDNDSTHTEGNTFVGNTATRGAGIHNWRTETTFEIIDNTFTDNVASDCGGGIQFDNNPYWVTMTGLWFEGNEANDGAAICTDMIYRDPEDVGGAKKYYQDSYIRVFNSAFIDNTASDDAIIYIKAGRIDATNIVMDGNEGADTSAIVAKGGTVNLVNAILTDNGGGALIQGEPNEEEEAIINISFSDLHDNDSAVEGIDAPVGSNGTIDEDPDFTGTYELAGSSPCINTGDPGIVDVDSSRSDMGLYGGPDGN